MFRGPGGWGGPEGVNKDVEGIPLGHGARLMGFRMIHKAYMPVYM